jgi:hypothetical protein
MRQMKLSIPAHWIAGRWWENRILWFFWGVNAVLFLRYWIATPGLFWRYAIAFVFISIVVSLGFIVVDLTYRRHTRRNSYSLPGED